MSFFPNALENLIDQFAALPGVGRKSAQRLAFHVLSLPEEEALTNFLNKLCTHVLECVFKLNLLCDSNTIVCD